MPAAVDADAFTGDEIAVHQEDHRLGDFRRTALSPERRGFDDLRVLLRSQIRRRQYWPGRDRIHQNFRRQFQRETFG